jgi:hypothetical protein
MFPPTAKAKSAKTGRLPRSCTALGPKSPPEFLPCAAGILPSPFLDEAHLHPSRPTELSLLTVSVLLDGPAYLSNCVLKLLITPYFRLVSLRCLRFRLVVFCYCQLKLIT